MEEVTTHDVSELKMTYEKIQVNGALEVPTGRDLATTEGVAAMHNA